MLTAKSWQPSNAAKEDEVWARQTSISGGSSEREQKEVAVKPRGVPSASRVVTTTTPAASRAIAARNSAGSGHDGGRADGAAGRWVVTAVGGFVTAAAPPVLRS